MILMSHRLLRRWWNQWWLCLWRCLHFDKILLVKRMIYEHFWLGQIRIISAYILSLLLSHNEILKGLLGLVGVVGIEGLAIKSLVLITLYWLFNFLLLLELNCVVSLGHQTIARWLRWLCASLKSSNWIWLHQPSLLVHLHWKCLRAIWYWIDSMLVIVWLMRSLSILMEFCARKSLAS